MSWPTGEVIYRGCDVHRCCDVHRGSDVHRGCRNFSAGNATHPGRFQPCTADRRRTPPPVLYGAGDVDTALSETVFHDLPIRGSKHLAHAQLVHRLVVALIARRDLLLVDLTSDGLRRLGLTRGELIESDSRSYPRTAAWARALHDHRQRVDGLLWASGQRDTGRALLLFGDRVKVSELALAPGAGSAHPRRRPGAAGGLRRRQPRRPHPLRPHPLRPHLTSARPSSAADGQTEPPNPMIDVQERALAAEGGVCLPCFGLRLRLFVLLRPWSGW